MASTEQDQKTSIVDMIVRERIARDGGRWDEMLSYWHPESIVEVSWFEGSGVEFVEQTKKTIRPDSINFHQISPAAVTIDGVRAIIDMPCVLQNFSQLDGIDVNQTGHTHLLWRARLTGDQWLIAGLRAYYMRDTLTACNPAQVPTVDDAEARRIPAFLPLPQLHSRRARKSCSGRSPRCRPARNRGSAVCLRTSVARCVGRAEVTLISWGGGGTPGSGLM